MQMIFNKKLHKEYQARISKEWSDYQTNEIFYEVKGAIREVEFKSGRIALIELVTWLPFSDYEVAYDKPEIAHWAFLGYKDDKSIYDMTFKEFKKENKKWIQCGDVASSAGKR